MDLVNYVPARPPRIFNETNPIQVEVGDFSRWGAVKFHEWDGTYDYAWQWATYGWAKIEGTLAPFQEFFRVTINKDPVADLDHLGDRSLVAFINSDHGKQYIYFSCYHYGYLEEVDSTNTFHKVEVTGRLTTWFYTYFQVSVTHRKAQVYMQFSDQLAKDDSSKAQLTHGVTSFQFVPYYFGLHLAKSHFDYPGFHGQIQQWYFVAGNGAYKIVTEIPDCIENPNGDYCVVPPTGEEECIILYEYCNYQGQNSRICADTPFTDIDYEVKSIKMVSPRHVYLYNLPCFHGENAEFSASVQCLEKMEFTMLAQMGIRLISEEVYFSEHPNGMSAKYKRPNLRKSKVLKTYQRI